MITEILKKEPGQPVRIIFKNRFVESKDNLEGNI